MSQVPVENMKNPIGYNVSLCFEWKDFDSCVTFEIVSDGPIKSKVEIIKDLISRWGGIVEMENDGTIINLLNFKTAYVTKKDEPPKEPTPKNGGKPYIRLVH